VTNSDINPKFQYPGIWYEYFSGDSIEVTDTQAKITFAPGEYRIYTSERITPPEGFITATSDLEASNIGLYPNVIRDEEYVYGYLPESSKLASVTLTNSNGLQLPIIFEENGSGILKMKMNDRLPGGMYIVQVNTKEKIYIGKIVKL
jgi:hypothetical protein